jgi:hypothetical protein
MEIEIIAVAVPDIEICRAAVARHVLKSNMPVLLKTVVFRLSSDSLL